MTSKQDIQVKENKNTINCHGVGKKPAIHREDGMAATVRFKKPQILAPQNRSRRQSVTLLNLSSVLVISIRT